MRAAIATWDDTEGAYGAYSCRDTFLVVGEWAAKRVGVSVRCFEETSSCFVFAVLPRSLPSVCGKLIFSLCISP